MTRVDRRTFVTRAVAGTGVAGAAWLAPSITSVAAAGPLCSASGCTPTPVSLLAPPFGSGVNIGDGVARSVNGTTVTGIRATGKTGADPARWQINNTVLRETGVIQSFQSGGITAGHIPLCIRGQTPVANDWVQLVLSFDPGVRKLSFTVTDIDSESGTFVNYQERIVLSWANGVGDAAPGYTRGSLVVSGGADVNQSSAPNQNVAASSANGNLVCTFDDCGTITQVTIRSENLRSAANVTPSDNGRLATITGLSWCV